MNDPLDRPTLASLVEEQWVDIQDHASYPTDRPGTFGTGRAFDKIDYLITSPHLRVALLDTGERRGSYHPNTWQPFGTVTGKANEASDRHLIWVDFKKFDHDANCRSGR